MDLDRFLGKCVKGQWRLDELDWTSRRRPMSREAEVRIWALVGDVVAHVSVMPSHLIVYLFTSEEASAVRRMTVAEMAEDALETSGAKQPEMSV